MNHYIFIGRLFREFMLAVLIGGLIFSFFLPGPASIARAQGAEQSIKDLLCAPTENLSGYNVGQGSDASKVATGGDLFHCINRLYKFGIAIASVAAVMFLVIAGYLYISGGEEAVSEAKTMIGSTVAGLVILLISYIFLRTINPDLIQFKPLQLPELTGADVSLCDPEKEDCVVRPDGSIAGKASPGVTTGPRNAVAANHQASELIAAGCTIQATGADAGVPKLTEIMFQATKQICANARAGNKKPQISYTTNGEHASRSYHYDGCAVDFAAGDSNYVNSAIGQAVIAAAKAAGIAPSRINPGSDANQTNHVHIDIAGRCGSESGNKGASSVSPSGVGLSLAQLKALQSSFEQEMKSSSLSAVLRSQWGARPEPFVERVIEKNLTPQYVVIHHTADISEGGGNTAKDVMKSIEKYQTVDRPDPFADVAYHFLISTDGQIFQGRYGGMEVKGAHFHGVNDGNIGIAMMGNFNNRTITPQAKESLTKLLRYIKGKYGINYKNATLVSKLNHNIPNLAKHSDINGLTADKFTTECPGKNLAPVIAELARTLGLNQNPNDVDVLSLR